MELGDGRASRIAGGIACMHVDHRAGNRPDHRRGQDVAELPGFDIEQAVIARKHLHIEGAAVRRATRDGRLGGRH
ncbi:MAG: hypothetical protein EOO64_02760 [Massilia sp.]|nr:MAG: hypothetical protein EOO64_02760 [Massilia sp.]